MTTVTTTLKPRGVEDSRQYVTGTSQIHTQQPARSAARSVLGAQVERLHGKVFYMTDDINRLNRKSCNHLEHLQTIAKAFNALQTQIKILLKAPSRVRGVTQLLECLPSTYRALGSIPAHQLGGVVSPVVPGEGLGSRGQEDQNLFSV